MAHRKVQVLLGCSLWLDRKLNSSSTSGEMLECWALLNQQVWRPTPSLGGMKKGRIKKQHFNAQIWHQKIMRNHKDVLQFMSKHSNSNPFKSAERWQDAMVTCSFCKTSPRALASPATSIGTTAVTMHARLVLPDQDGREVKWKILKNPCRTATDPCLWKKHPAWSNIFPKWANEVEWESTSDGFSLCFLFHPLAWPTVTEIDKNCNSAIQKLAEKPLITGLSS